MSMKFVNGSRSRPKNSGLTAAVGLCIAAVCLVAAATVINTRTGSGKLGFISEYLTKETEATASAWAGPENEQPEVYIDTPADNTTEIPDVAAEISASPTEAAAPEAAELEASADYPAVEDTDADIDETAPQPLDLDESEAVPASAAVSFRMPLAGTVLKDYSGENLVYCSTMCDWRVHQGVDITGEADCEIRAAADGIVVDFVEDMLYGHTAIIRQEDDSMLYYCGLSSVPMVTAGLEVHAGDVIGRLGVVPCEATDPPHLHLALMKDGSFINPLSLMGL